MKGWVGDWGGGGNVQYFEPRNIIWKQGVCFFTCAVWGFLLAALVFAMA